MDGRTTIRRNVEILSAGVDEDEILLDPSVWTYVFLNETAARIWNVLDSPRSIEDVVESLLRDYEVDAATCEREVEEFVGDMSRRGVLIVDAAV